MFSMTYIIQSILQASVWHSVRTDYRSKINKHFPDKNIFPSNQQNPVVPVSQQFPAFRQCASLKDYALQNAYFYKTPEIYTTGSPDPVLFRLIPHGVLSLSHLQEKVARRIFHW